VSLRSRGWNPNGSSVSLKTLPASVMNRLNDGARPGDSRVERVAERIPRVAGGAQERELAADRVRVGEPVSVAVRGLPTTRATDSLNETPVSANTRGASFDLATLSVLETPASQVPPSQVPPSQVPPPRPLSLMSRGCPAARTPATASENDNPVSATARALPGVLATLSPWLTPVSESGRGAVVVRVGLSSWMYAVRVLVSDPRVLVTVSRTE
jgi:hypothetical protein